MSATRKTPEEMIEELEIIKKLETIKEGRNRRKLNLTKEISIKQGKVIGDGFLTGDDTLDGLPDKGAEIFETATLKMQALIVDFCLETCITKAEKLGIQIKRCVNFEEEKVTDTVNLRRKSHIFTVCMSGMNRSQATPRALEDKAADNEWIMAPPHGVDHGMDPCISEEHAKILGSDFNFADFKPTPITSSVEESHPFLPYFSGKKRLPKAGEDFFRRNWPDIADKDDNFLPLPDVQKMRAYMDENYFLDIIKKRADVITFATPALHRMLYRLIEVANKNNISLDGVVLHPILAVDPFNYENGDYRNEKVLKFIELVKTCIRVAVPVPVNSLTLFASSSVPEDAETSISASKNRSRCCC